MAFTEYSWEMRSKARMTGGRDGETARRRGSVPGRGTLEGTRVAGAFEIAVTTSDHMRMARSETEVVVPHDRVPAGL